VRRHSEADFQNSQIFTPRLWPAPDSFASLFEHLRFYRDSRSNPMAAALARGVANLTFTRIVKVQNNDAPNR
jgi:hypothetical protein